MAKVTQCRVSAFLDPEIAHWRVRCALASDPAGVREYTSGDGTLRVWEADAPTLLGAASVFGFVEMFRREIRRCEPHVTHVSTPRATIFSASARLVIASATPRARWHYIYPIVTGSVRLLTGAAGEVEMTNGFALLHAAEDPSRVAVDVGGGDMGCVLDGVAW